MANATLPPQTPEEQDERYNVANNLYQQEFNAATMSDAEKQRLRDIAKTDQMEAAEADPTKKVREGEAAAANPMGYEASGKSKIAQARRSAITPTTNPIKLLNVAKKGGPAALLLSILGGVIFLILGALPLMPIHVYQSILEKFDSNNTSYTIRTNKLIVNKLTDKTTTGLCAGKINIACKFSRPSNYMLKNMEASGITAFDKNGNKIVSKDLWPNTRPASYTYVKSNGDISDPISAKNLKSALSSKPDFRDAFHTALRTRLQTFSDSVFKTVYGKFGATKQDVAADAKDEDEVNKKIEDQTNGSEVEKNDDGTVKNSKTKDEITGDVTEDIGKEVDKIKLSGSGVGLVAGGVCLAMDGPGIITRTARAYQLAQLVRFGAVFMTVASAMKAGNATPTETAAIGTALTAVYASKSALDSFGMKYTLYGDTSPAKGSNYKSYVPGGKVSEIFGTAAAIFDSPAKKDICAGATSPVTGVAIDAALAPETLGIGTLINIGVGVIGGLTLAAVVSSVLPAILNVIPDSVYQDLGKAAFGDITANLKGENYGDALASGSANTLGQLANAGGNSPLSVDQAVAYNQETQKVNVAYAEEDRTALSPLDASNKNTFMGSIVDSLTPLYSQVGSLTSVLSSVGSIVGTATNNTLLGSAYAATNDTAQYSLCDDPSLTSADGKKVAAGPFCNVQYGIPAEYLDMDPQDVVNDMITAGQIDEDTGEAKQDASAITGQVAGALGLPEDTNITNYYDWLQTCTDGTTDQAYNCEIKDKQTAEYALYTIDHRIQKNIDNEDTDPSSGLAINNTPTVTDVPTTVCTKEQLASFKTATTSSDTNLRTIINNGANKAVLGFRPATYNFSDFQSDDNGIEVGTGISALLGAGIDSTYFQMTPGSSTKKNQVPGASGRDFLTNKTNQFTLMRVDNGSPTLCGFTLKGTNQNHLYNGLRLQGTDGAVVSAVKITSIPGDDDVPPGETFSINDSHTNKTTYNSVEVDGGNVGASGFGCNNSNNTTITNSSFHDDKYGNGVTFWQCNNATMTDTVSTDNKDFGVNFERFSGTATLTRINTKNNKQGDYRIVTDQDSAKVNIIDPIYAGSKIKIKVNSTYLGKSEQQSKSDIHVIIGGVDKTSEVVQWVN